MAVPGEESGFKNEKIFFFLKEKTARLYSSGKYLVKQGKSWRREERIAELMSYSG